MLVTPTSSGSGSIRFSRKLKLWQSEITDKY